MEELNLLLREVILNPDDDTVRLVYADRLAELAADTERVKCRQCLGKCKVPYCSGFMYSCEELNVDCDCGTVKICDRCNGSGTVLDTSMRDLAEFIRNDVQWEIIRGSCRCAAHGMLLAGYHGIDLCEACLYLKRRGELWSARSYQKPVGPLIAVRDTDYFGRLDSHQLALYRRGFIEELDCTAETFLAVAGDLVWNDKQTEKCHEPGCEGGVVGWTHNGFDDTYCLTCNATGLVPRPCPPTAHPITKVFLTTEPNDRDFGTIYSVLGTPIRYYCYGYPGIEFKLPPRS